MMKTLLYAIIILILPQAFAEYRVGAIISLTGDAAKNGKNILEGVQFASERLGVKLIIEDDQTSPAKCSAAFDKLVSRDRVDAVIGGTWDFLAETAFPLAAKYKVPFITPSNPPEVLSEAAGRNPWIFTNALSLAAEEEVIDRFLAGKRVRSLALVVINVPYGQLHAKLMHRLALSRGIRVSLDLEIGYAGFEDSIKKTVIEIQRNKPDLVFFVLNYEGVDLAMREMEKLKVRPLVLMPQTLREALEFSNKPARYSEAYGIFQKYSPDTSFSSLFEKRFGHPPYGYAGSAYDAVAFLVDSANHGINLSDPAATFRYEGTTGLHILPAPRRSLALTSAVIAGVKEGKLTELTP